MTDDFSPIYIELSEKPNELVFCTQRNIICFCISTSLDLSIYKSILILNLMASINVYVGSLIFVL